MPSMEQRILEAIDNDPATEAAYKAHMELVLSKPPVLTNAEADPEHEAALDRAWLQVMRAAAAYHGVDV